MVKIAWIITTLLAGVMMAMLAGSARAEDVLPTVQNKPENINVWTAGDTAMQATFLTMLAVDRGQTQEEQARRYT